MGRPHHILLYGPPGAGKLTVARVLSERFGLGLLDNHVAVDAALRLYLFGDPGFDETCEQIRVVMLRSAAAAGRDVVSTFAYAHGVDDEAIQTLIAASAGATVTVVQLLPDVSVNRQRVHEAERVGTNKITDLDLFDSLTARLDLRTAFSGTSLSIDNTDLSAEAVAEQIARFVGLTAS